MSGGRRPGGGEEAVGFEVSSLLVERPSGVAVYGAGLIGALAALRPEREHLQVHRLSRLPRRRLLPHPDLPAQAYLDGRRLHRRCGLLHALDTRLPRRYGGVLVATLFDVISALPLAAERSLSSERFLARKTRDYGFMARRADLVITLSGETRDRFREMADGGPPVVVAPPGVDPGFSRASPPPPALRERLGLRGDYLVAVGLLCPRKNPEAVLGAFLRARARHPGLSLALAGEEGEGWRTPAVERALAEGGDGVRLLGYVPRPELAALYAGAKALLYLSHYEGFGLPVLEAMAAGAPVIASRRGGIPEAAGEAALLVEPDRQSDIDSAVERVLQDGAFADGLRDLGRRRSAGFTWEAAARAVEEAYRQARAARAATAGTQEGPWRGRGGGIRSPRL